VEWCGGLGMPLGEALYRRQVVLLRQQRIEKRAAGDERGRAVSSAR
jgi:hypothetical protein